MEHNSQFVLSYDLLALLEWMVEHDAPTLKKIIAKALKSGLQKELQRTAYTTHSVESAHNNMLDFFGMLETLMLESMQEQSVESATEKQLMPAIDQIDSTACDPTTIRTSIEKATAALEHRPKANPHDVLFRELLRHWKPSKKTTTH